MAKAKAKEEGDRQCSNERIPPPPPSPNPNPRKRNNSKDIVPSLYNCHSCDRHVPSRRQTLTSLHPLDSEWRIVLLCDQCLRLIKSASKCSYCFADLPAAGDEGHLRLLECRQCSCRIHFNCVPTQQRFVSLALLKPESFVCVDCCALPRFGSKKPRCLFNRVSLGELLKEAQEKASAAAKAKEKALEKVRAAKSAAERAREALGAVSVRTIDPADTVVKDDESVILKKRDEELALMLHLAMNGSQRILRSGWSMSSDRSAEAKRARQRKGCFKKVEFCREDKGFLDFLRSSVEPDMFEEEEEKKEIDGCSSSKPVENVVKHEHASCSDKDNNTLTGWITYQRASKSKGVGSREQSSGKDDRLNGIGAGENSCKLEKMSRCGPPDRYAKKYVKRKPILKEASDGELDTGRQAA